MLAMNISFIHPHLHLRNKAEADRCSSHRKQLHKATRVKQITTQKSLKNRSFRGSLELLGGFEPPTSSLPKALNVVKNIIFVENGVLFGLIYLNRFFRASNTNKKISLESAHSNPIPLRGSQRRNIPREPAFPSLPKPTAGIFHGAEPTLFPALHPAFRTASRPYPWRAAQPTTPHTATL